MLTASSQESDHYTFGKRTIMLLLLLVVLSFFPLALQAFSSLSATDIPPKLYGYLFNALSVATICLSGTIFLVALCLEKRGIKKVELWLSLLYGVTGVLFTGYAWIQATQPEYLPVWRLTIEYLAPVVIASQLGLLGSKDKKPNLALSASGIILSTLFLGIAYLKPACSFAVVTDYSPIHNPYELLPLFLILLCAFVAYPRLTKSNRSFTLMAFWVTTAPAACSVVLSFFSDSNHSDSFLFSLSYVFLSRAIVLSGLLADVLKEEKTIILLEETVSEQTARLEMSAAKQADAEKNIERIRRELAEVSFYRNAFTKAFDNSQSIALLLNPAGKIIATNHFSQASLELPDEISAADLDITMLLGDTDVWESSQSVLAAKKDVSRSIQLKKLRSNTLIDVSARFVATYEDGPPEDMACIIFTAQDTHLQKVLKDENLKLKWQLSVSPTPIIEFSPDGTITFQNGPAELIDTATSGWNHPLLLEIQPKLDTLLSETTEVVERKHHINGRDFQQTLTYNALFNRFILHSLDITESGKKLAENEKIVNYTGILQQQFCIHYNEPYNLLNIILKESIDWLHMGEAVLCRENEGRLTRVATWPESAIRTGMTEPHSDLLMQMLANVPSGPFEIPTEDGSDTPCMGYHLNVNDKPWGVVYYVGPTQPMKQQVRHNILGNIGTWMNLVVSHARSKDVAMRHYHLSPTAMFTCLEDGKITHVNTAFEKLFNVPEDTISSHTLVDFLSEHDKHRESEFLTIPVGEWMRESIVHMQTSPNNVASYRLFCSADPMNEQLFCMLVPEKSANGQSALGHEGMARIGKEISNPLNCVVGMTELLEVSGLDIRQHNFVQQIRQSADMLIGLSETIHNYSLLRSHELELNVSQFDLQDLLELVFSSFESEAASKTVSLFLHYSPNTPRCFWGDRERIASVLRNLLGNAVRLTDIGYISVIVKTSTDAASQSNTVVITVEDSGSGVATDEVSQIFDEFSSFSQAQQFSCGLGLATAKKLATAMGGDITVESSLGQGSVFTLNLGIQPSPAMRDSQTTVCDLNIHRAMLLMTDPIAMQVINTTLNDAALEKETYTDSTSALNALQKAGDENKPYNLVIVDEDIRHPEVNNFAKLAKQCAGNDNLKLVKYSPEGYKTRDERQDGLFEETILSPVTPQRILKTLRSIYSSEHPELEQLNPVSDHTLELNRPISILIADSDPMNREIMRGLLEPSPALVDISTDGSRTVELACRHKYDIIFTVIDLPNMDGFEVTKAIRKVEANKRHTPIIAILQVDSPSIRKSGRSAGMDTFITKPIRRRNLNRILHEFIIETAVVNTTPTISQTETVDLYPLEIDRAATEMGVKKKLYVRIFKIFTDSLDEHLNSIVSVFKKKDEANLSKAARKLGRSAANLHLFELKNSCLKLEELADAGEWDSLGEQIKGLKKHAKQLKELGQNLLS